MATVKDNKDNKDNKNELKFIEFDDIKVSTKTFIVTTNITLNIDKLFAYLPITDYTLIPKRRGRKKKNEAININKNIPSGSIVTLEYENKIRGVDLKKKRKNKDKKKRGNYFRNSITVVMIEDDKKINFKISRNGKFQMTGCKFDHQAEKCVQYIWNYISDKDAPNDIFTMNGPNLTAIFVPAMRNIDFSLNFVVDREKLDEYFNTSTNYYSLLETSFGYTGVNIKIPFTKPISTLKLKKLQYLNGEWLPPTYVPYSEYLDMLSPKDMDKKLKKQRFNTFLVFHSGKTIMSGMEESFMRDTYYTFLNIIRACHSFIEERLEPDEKSDEEILVF